MKPLAADTTLPNSAISAVEWPAIPSEHGALLLALQHQLDQSQWWPPDVLLDAQLQQLRLLLRHAAATVPWQRLRFTSCGFDPGAAFSLDEFRHIPVMTRRDVQSADTELLSVQPLPSHGQVFDRHTSGSTGTPVRFRSNDLKQVFWHAFTLRDHLWHRRDLSGKFAAIRIAGEEGNHPSWGLSAGAAFTTGPGVQLSIRAGLDDQIRWLQAEQPNYLLSYPSNLLALAQLSIERGIALPFLHEVLTFGEMLSEECRATLATAWGARVSDMYSAQEVGYIALQCPDSTHYHVQAEGVLVEVLDELAVPCGPGEAGRVVVTDLHNFAMPFIRYDIGDFATAGAPCACGRGLPVLHAIAGRVRNMLVLPNGQRRFPRIGASALASVAPIRQYQFVQIAPDCIEVRLVVSRSLDSDTEARITQVLHAKLGYPFRVRFAYCESIPRDPLGKFEDFRSEIAPA
jgi:phenylacetate-CoA ligase